MCRRRFSRQSLVEAARCLSHSILRLRILKKQYRLAPSAPAMIHVLLVERRLPARRRLSGKRHDRDLGHPRGKSSPHFGRLVVERVEIPPVEIDDRCFEPRLLAQLAGGGSRRVLTVVECPRDDVPIPLTLG